MDNIYNIVKLKSTEMATLNLKVKKQKMPNPQSKEAGFVPRVVTNGTADFADIAKYACKGSTISAPEMEASSKLFCEAAAEQIKNGYIVDLGPLGKLYPSVTGKWAKNKEDLSKADLKAKVNYRAGNDIAAAIAGATLSWASEKDEAADNSTDPDNTDPGTGGADSGSGEEFPDLEV